ncbi:MAG: hypothetical protein AB9846_14270 [Tenuifilaceae bacterium]
MNNRLAICTIKHDIMLKKSMIKKAMYMCKKMHLSCRPEVKD